MKHAKHTPGPWSANQAFCPGRNEWVIEIQGEENFVADVKIVKTETSNANAALIAAAPELLEALLYVANDDGCPPDVANVVLKAIAKARGEA